MMKNKKGVSEMIAYVLLILIAIGLSVGVYTWIKTYIPQEKITCPDGASLIIKDVECLSNSKVKITFENKGRFDVDGAYIRIANSRTGGEPILEIKPTSQTIALREPGFFTFIGANGLRSGQQSEPIIFDYKTVYENGDEVGDNNNQLDEIQIIPFVIDKKTNEYAMCENAVFSRKESCS